MANIPIVNHCVPSKLVKLYYLGTSIAIVMILAFYGSYYVYLQKEALTEINYATAMKSCKNKIRQTPSNDSTHMRVFQAFPCGEDLYIKKCGTCAYVTGSGHLKDSKKGKEIDSYDCVFRSNSAPIVGYEEDVGKRTDFRTVDHMAIKFITEQVLKQGVESFDLNTFNHTIFLGYKVTWHGEITEMVNLLKDHPEMSFYIMNDPKLEELRALYHEKIGSTNFFMWMTNGFVSLLTMRDFCDEIHVYGIADESRCDKVKLGRYEDAPYHYYGLLETIETECWRFWRHGNGFWGHQYMKEKRLFKKWADDWGNLYFHQPEWN